MTRIKLVNAILSPLKGDSTRWRQLTKLTMQDSMNFPKEQNYSLGLKVTCRVRLAYLKWSNHQFFTVFLNKFLKHIFNIVLKLNNHTWKKYKIIFLWKKNEAQVSGFAVVKKAPSPWKKIFTKKEKFFQFIWAYIIFKTVCGHFF